MGIGLFHIAVHELDIVADGRTQIGADKCFSGSAFPTGNTDDHNFSSYFFGRPLALSMEILWGLL